MGNYLKIKYEKIFSGFGLMIENMSFLIQDFMLIRLPFGYYACMPIFIGYVQPFFKHQRDIQYKNIT